MSPCLVGPTSAGTTAPPSSVRSSRTGCAGTSMSQRSWWTVWNTHLSAPVLTSSATMDEEYFSTASLRFMPNRSEEHTSELQSLMRNSYAVFCLKKNKLVNDHIGREDV